MSDSQGFEDEFANDEDVEEMIDNIISTVGESIVNDEQRTSIINPIKLQQIQFAYKTLRYMIRGSGAKVTYKLHEPFNSVGYVSIAGKMINIKRPEWFVKVAEYASNFEVYPKTDGTIQANFTFLGLTKPIE